MLHTKSVMTVHLLHTNEMHSVRTYATYENAICPNLCYDENMMSDVRFFVTYERV